MEKFDINSLVNQQSRLARTCCPCASNKEMIVENAWDYVYSSARNYADMDGLLDVFVLDHNLLIRNWK